MSSKDKSEKAEKPKGKGMIVIIGVAVAMLAAGGGGAFALVQAGVIGGEKKHEDNSPKLVHKGEEDPYAPKAEGGKEGEGAKEVEGEGGSPYKTTYYSFPDDFTSNLKNSSSLIQVSLACSTHRDGRVLMWLKKHELAIRSAMLSLQEVKDENKESEGSPENKQAIRQRQRQVAMAGVAASMHKAQFVITNPTHFSVAMAYDPELAPAPVVLAKGRGEKALAMRELAAELGIPCLEFPALARSVYFTTRERQMIREELYQAVAGILAFVFSLKRGEERATPIIDVPVALRFDAEGRLDAAATN